MTKLTLDEARSQLHEAEAKYRTIEAEQQQLASEDSTADRVLRDVEIKGALFDAANEVIEVKKKFDEVKAESEARRRSRAAVELAEAEMLLGQTVDEAELRIAELQETLARVLALSKRRYAHRQELTGRAPRSHLGRAIVTGWLQFRLRDLDLPDLGHPPHHHRDSLAHLLGLGDEGKPSDPQETS